MNKKEHQQSSISVDKGFWPKPWTNKSLRSELCYIYTQRHRSVHNLPGTDGSKCPESGTAEPHIEFMIVRNKKKSKNKTPNRIWKTFKIRLDSEAQTVKRGFLSKSESAFNQWVDDRLGCIRKPLLKRLWSRAESRRNPIQRQTLGFVYADTKQRQSIFYWCFTAK